MAGAIIQAKAGQPAPLWRAVFRLTSVEGFAEWNKGNMLVDANGTPRVWMHATDTPTFNIFTRWGEHSVGFHLGNLEAASTRLEHMSWPDGDGLEARQGHALMPVVARASNPLRLPDCHIWEQDRVAAELLDRGLINEPQACAIEESCAAEFLFAALEEAGHDAVLYANETEDGGRGDSLLLWRAEQIKGVFSSLLDLGDPRVLSQTGGPQEDLEAWRWTASAIADARLALRAACGLRLG